MGMVHGGMYGEISAKEERGERLSESNQCHEWEIRYGERKEKRGRLEFHRAQRTQEVRQEESEMAAPARLSMIGFHQSHGENIS